ncbi:MAG: hypothetical protein ACK4SF_18445 [Algoriphagus aquaeductus]|uniref:hypothetical protein n=1 Tax=Algoriphagus aquaeductus TaxID=475299 RepID=UPI00391C5981
MKSILQKEAKSQATLVDPTREVNSFEFLPSWTLQIPMVLIALFWALRLGRLNFFSAVNPSMAFGGLFIYSKSEIMEKLAPSNRPQTLILKPNTQEDSILAQLKSLNMDFPLFAKPDLGERGRGVSKLNSPKELAAYLDHFANETLLLQESISLHQEYGVFVLKDPKTGKLQISSITAKIPLQVLGDGHSKVIELCKNHPRASRYLHEIPSDLLEYVPEKGQIQKLSDYGNHCRGAAFIDQREWISPEIIQSFEQICAPLDGFYYGRLDVKVQELADLAHPEQIKVLEINGANSEPIHLYSSHFTYLEAIEELINHIGYMATIARINLRKTSAYPGILELIRNLKRYSQLQKSSGHRGS